MLKKLKKMHFKLKKCILNKKMQNKNSVLKVKILKRIDPLSKVEYKYSAQIEEKYI